MRALTVQPGVANSIQLTDVPPPPEADGALLVRAVALGICGTDHEIISGEYGWAPSHQQRLILGHESLGRIEEAPAGISWNFPFWYVPEGEQKYVITQ